MRSDGHPLDGAPPEPGALCDLILVEDAPSSDTLFLVSNNGILGDNDCFAHGVIQAWCCANGVTFTHVMGTWGDRLVFPSARVRVHFKLKFDFLTAEAHRASLDGQGRFLSA